MGTENLHNTYNSLYRWNNFRLRLVLEAIGVGLITGLVVALFRYLVDKSAGILLGIYRFLAVKPELIPIWIGILVLIGLIVSQLTIKYEPAIKGSGVPQVEAVLLGKIDMTWWKVITGKLVGAVLSIGAGLSIGPEGPSVQLGAAVGQGFSRIFKRLKVEEKYLITSGTSAGLAAIFNAPLAGVMFALEEFHKNFSPLIIITALSAVMSSDFITSEFIGLKPMFDFHTLKAIPLRYYAYIVVLGVLLGVLGVTFEKVLFKTQGLYAMQKWLPRKFWITVPLLISVILGFELPQVMGSGSNLITSLLMNNFPLLFLLILFFAKFLFTMLSYGSGAPGGLFLPILAIGALIGNAYGFAVAHLFHLNSIYIKDFTILAMAGYFTAVLRIPLTGTILITEMTGSFDHLLSLTVISFIAYLVVNLIGTKPLNETLMERILEQGELTAGGNESAKMLIEYAVSMGSHLDGKQIKDVEWPSECLLVAVRRGAKEIIPTGDTSINAGDFLVILTNGDRVGDINDFLNEVARSGEGYLL